MTTAQHTPETIVSPSFATWNKMKLPPLKAVIIDWDGTLVENRAPSNTIKKDMIERALALQHNNGEQIKLPPAFWAKEQERTVKDIIKHYFQSIDPVNWEDRAKTGYEVYVGLVTEKVQAAIRKKELAPIKDALKTMEWLVAHNTGGYSG